MALPTTIVSTASMPGRNCACGPYFSSAGNVYVVISDATALTPHVYKATDPTPSFSEMDGSNRPTGRNDGDTWVVQNGDTLQMAYGGMSLSSPTYRYAQFSMATDTWASSPKNVTIAAPTLSSSGAHSLSLVRRSNGDLIAMFNGQRENVSGNKDRVYYSKSTDGGATWGTPSVDLL